MKNTRISNLSALRDSWLEVNMDTISSNVKELKKFIPESKKIMAIVKADAYGHGATMIAPTLLASGIDMLGVASIDEGIALRESGITCEILVLSSVPAWTLKTALENDICVSIFTEEQLKACKQIYERTSKPVKVHIKINTGMNRIGIRPNQAVEFINKVQSAEYVDLKGVFTHLAFAENVEETEKQFSLWNDIISKIDTKELLIHILNTAGVICYDCLSNMVRLGIAIYGFMPDLPENQKNIPKLKQVMSVKARINYIHEIEKNEGVSYSHTFIADKKTTVATVPIGYADGISRNLSNKLAAHINGQKIKQIGNIAMDQMMFDITGLDVHEGDVITLSDETLPISDWANILNTIHYELTCRLKVRLARVYTR